MGSDIDMVDSHKNALENATIINHSPADPRLLQTQNSDVEQADDEGPQALKIYHIQNCGMVYLDSLNSRHVAMENCGNHISETQVTYHRRVNDRKKSDKVIHSQSRAVDNGDPSPRTSRTEINISVDYVVLSSCAVFVAVLFLAFITNSPRLCGSGEGTVRM